MTLGTTLRILAALAVAAVVGFTGMLAYHVTQKPLDGEFSRLIPEPASLKQSETETRRNFVSSIETMDMPEIDPSQQSFLKARDLLALGKIPEAREKLTTIFNVFPNSASAATARRIVGDMNLDEILIPGKTGHTRVHTVQRGDSYLAIAARYGTTIDCIMEINGMTELKNIQPGDEIVVMPLDFRILIEARRKSVSLWDKGRFIREYPALSMRGAPRSPQRSTISSKIAELDSRRVNPQSIEYRAADKILQCSSPSLQIRSWDPDQEEPLSAILLRPQDMEELALLTRIGNEIEFR